VVVLCAGKVTVGGFAPAERHRIHHISTYRLNGLRKGDEHPTYTPVRCIALYFLWSPYGIGQTIIKLDWLDKLKYLGCFLTATPVKLILVAV